MIDAYSKFFEKYDKNLFFKDGLGQIIYINDDLIEQQWETLIRKLSNNEKLFIRGYGRDSAGTSAFLILYKHLFKNENIRKDATNNIEPTKVITNLTGYSKTLIKDRDDLIRIQNYQVSHLFGRTKNPLLFTSAWNIAYIPKFIDPFTGHETQGEYNKEFKTLFMQQNKSRFAKYVSKYNDFVEKNINPKLDKAFKSTEMELSNSNINFD